MEWPWPAPLTDEELGIEETSEQTEEQEKPSSCIYVDPESGD